MRINKFLKSVFSRRHHHLPVYTQQASYLLQASEALCNMTETMDYNEWKRYEKEIKACEVQGDAILTEFYDMLSENILSTIRRSDMQTIAMDIDEFLDRINDSAKSILLYSPAKIDPHIKDLAQYINAQADAVKKIMFAFGDLKNNYAQIAVQCERITELEHAADDTFAEYIGYIFTHEDNPIEVMKYKNIAEAFEATTDAAKAVCDIVRKIMLRYIER